MKRYRRFNYGGITMLAGLLALVIVLLNGGDAQASPQYSVDCSYCHQMPPLDSGTATKNPATGAVPGSHQGHATSAVSTCAKCHGAAVATYPTGHRNKAIELVGGLGYSRGFVNQTSVPPNPLGTCATASCHFGSVTPAWGSTPFAAPGDCAQCHGVAPSTGNHPVGATKHATYYGTGVGSCEKCHANHTAEAKPFAHATSAGQRAIEVKFVAAPNSGGTFAANQCSNLYCHSNGSGGAPNTIPTWGGTLDCKGCHNSDVTSGVPMASNKHDKHINNAAVLGTNYGCVECHAQTVSGNTTIADVTKHVNSFVNFSGANAGKNFVAGNCSTTYCHSDGKGTFKTAGWTGAETLDCKGCHGSDAAPAFASTAGEPNYANGGAGALQANTHQKHVTGAADCVKCHSTTTSNGTAITGNHTNKAINLAAGGGKSFDFGANKTCSNISCHSGDGIIVSVGAAQWGATLGCAGCHGDASTLATNAHATHVSGKGYACATCHSATVASGNSPITNASLHGNSAVNVAGSFTFTAADKSCAVTCHMSATPQWNVAASGACGTCHAALPSTGGLIGSNGHTAHFSATYGPSFSSADATACANCHVYTTDLAATHADGSVNIQASLNFGSGNCTSCHQQATNWAGGRVSCESCHTTGGGALSVISGVTAPDKTLASSAGHGKTGINQGCAACHNDTSAHISGALGDNKRLLGSLTGSLNTECNFCHNDPVKVTNPQHQNMDTHLATMDCSQCHNPHGTTNTLMVETSLNGKTVSFSGTNFVNAQGTGVCQACHTATDYYRVDVAETNHPDTNCLECHQHNSQYGGAFEPNRACDSCHGYPPAPRVVTTAVTYGIQGNWSSARFEDYSGGGGAHLVAAHIPKSAKPSDGWANCIPCHNEGAATHNKAMPMRNHVENVSVKVDPQYRFSNDYFITYTSAKLISGGANKSGSCFNVSCHFKTTDKWSIER